MFNLARMFENILNSFISTLFYSRQRQWKRYVSEPEAVQAEQFRFLTSRGAQTGYGRHYGMFAGIDYKEFARRLPLTTYARLHPYIQRMQAGEKDVLWPGQVRYYAQSSGTTSTRSKYIPVPDEMLDDNHFRGGKDMILNYLSHYPDSKFLLGKALKLGGTTRRDRQKNIIIGDLSGIMIDRLPFWAQFRSVPSEEISLLPDWTEKIDRIKREVTREDVRAMVGIPTWFLKLLTGVLEMTGKKTLAGIWPNLEVFFHGGISFTPYRAQFDRLIGKPDMRYMEVYNASEGFFALQNEPKTRDLLLMLDYRIFYEFIPMKDFRGTDSTRVLPLEEVKTGEDYALVISSASGLWRYIVGDTVRFTSLRPYKLVITGRTKHFLNIVGEEVMVHNTDAALQRVCERYGVHSIDYTVSAVPPGPEGPGYHEWLVEFDRAPENTAAFARDLDDVLRELNSDYDIKRTKNISLSPLRLHIASPGLFDRWMARRNKLGGQHKVPRLSADRQYLEELLQMNGQS